MMLPFEKQFRENKVISRECRLTMRVSLSLLLATTILGIIASRLKTGFGMERPIQNLWGIFNVIAVIIIITNLGVRRTIYFSSRLSRENLTLTALLRKWRLIDLILLSCAELVALLGLIITIMGMPFARTWHFFVCAFLLTMIHMPIPFKVRDKLRYFEKHAGQWLDDEEKSPADS
jgi:hypothetical protein